VEKKVNAIIALGSNLGNRNENIEKAIEKINQRIGKTIGRGMIIETEPFEMESDSMFLNTCIEINTILSPDKLLDALQKIEIDLGRPKETKGKNIQRPIDLDIIFYDDFTIISDNLTIPHSKYHLRDFVLQPLLSLNPNYFDPRKKLIVKQLIC
jgi:2-amino-4-hydroxy-6-hydroxymethyldihydropteridine diphosphokinase